MRILIVLLVFASACVAQPDYATTEQSICNPDLDDCPGGHPITDAELKAETRNHYGQSTGRVDCTGVTHGVGNHVAWCHITSGGITLFDCTFQYYEHADGEVELWYVSCG